MILFFQNFSEKLKSNLNALVESYTGRDEQEGKVLDSLLEKPNTVANITGMGGIGKSTVATAVGHRLADEYHYYVVFLNLRGEESPVSIPATIFLQMNIELPASNVDKTEQLSFLLKQHKDNILIVFDDAEDSLAVNDQFMKILATLSRIQNVVCIVTSRTTIQAIDIELEHIKLYELSRTSSSTLLQSLLGKKYTPDMVSIIDACGRSPLAIRLVSALLKTTSMVNTKAIIDDIKKSLLQKTTRAAGNVQNDKRLHACISSSYAHLNDSEKKLFRILSIFPNTFQSQAVDKMTSSANELELCSLVNRSMCSYDENSKLYSLHTLLKHFGSMKLKEAKEKEDTVKTFTRYMVHHICQLSEQYFSEDSKSAIKTLKEGLQNVEYVLRLPQKHDYICQMHELTSLGSQHVHAFLKNHLLSFSTRKSFYSALVNNPHLEPRNKVAILYILSEYAGHSNYNDALRYYQNIEEVLGKKLDKAVNPRDIALTFYQTKYAYTLYITGQKDQALELVKLIKIPECKENMTLEQKYLLMKCHYTISFVYINSESYTQCLEELRKAKELLVNHLPLGPHIENIRIAEATAACLIEMELATSPHTLKEAELILDEAVKMCKDSGRHRSGDMIRVLNTMAKCSVVKQNYVEASSKCKEALKMLEDLGLEKTGYHSAILSTMGHLLYKSGNYTAAISVYKKAIPLCRQYSIPHNVAARLSMKAHALRADGKLDEAVEAYREALNVFAEISYTDGVVRRYKDLFSVYSELGDHDRAKECKIKMEALGITELETISEMPSEEREIKTSACELGDCDEDAPESL